MKLLPASVFALCAIVLATSAQAADPKKQPGNKRLMDHSNPLLISEDAAKKVMVANIPEKAWKIIKGSQYVWVSQVEGGMNGATCVVTARVMVLPLTASLNVPMFRPKHTAIQFWPCLRPILPPPAISVGKFVDVCVVLAPLP